MSPIMLKWLQEKIDLPIRNQDGCRPQLVKKVQVQMTLNNRQALLQDANTKVQRVAFNLCCLHWFKGLLQQPCSWLRILNSGSRRQWEREKQTVTSSLGLGKAH